MTKLRMIPEGEKFSSSDDLVSPGVWRSKFSFRRVRDGARYEKFVTWDFRDCTEAELQQLCMYDLRVWVQGRLRDAGEAALDNSAMFENVNVKKDRIEAARQPVDPIQRFVRAGVALGMSEAEAREFALAQVAKTKANPDAEAPETEDANGVHEDVAN